MMSKDDRQEIGVQRYESCGGQGTLQYVTGFGKTITAIKIIKRLRRTVTDREVIVIVPREQLQKQWVEVLTKHDCINNTHVLIINSAIKRTLTCSLLILDEIHRYAAEGFSQIFERVTYRFILGLTATFKRLDQRHKIFKSLCPVIDTIDIVEARANGWIAEYQEFNLGIELSTDDMDRYRKLEETYTKALNFFMWDFGLMKDCSLSHKPVKYIDELTKSVRYMQSSTAQLASKYGWKGNSAYGAHQLLGTTQDFWSGNTSHPYHPNKIYVIAINGMRAIRGMKSFIQSHDGKLKAARDILVKFPLKSITFSETIERADKITEMAKLAGIASASYHTKIKSMYVGGKRLNKKQTAEFILEEFRLNNLQNINAAKALDEGSDIDDLELGVRVDGSSSATNHTQRRGRITRKKGLKQSVMINLYLKGTTDVKWLTKSQGPDAMVQWVDSIEEIEESI